LGKTVRPSASCSRASAAVASFAVAMAVRGDEEAADPRMELEHEFLDSAKSFGWAAVRSMLKETPDLINVQPSGRWTALHQAAYSGQADICKELVGLGADIQAVTRSGQTPADVAKGEAKKVLDEAPAPPADDVPKGGEEPPTKRARRAKPAARVRSMNINFAVDKEYEWSSLREIASAPVSALQGISEENGGKILKGLGIKTVRGLGRWKFYKIAKAITGLAEKEQEGGRHEGAVMNVDAGLKKAHEGKTLKDIAKLPPTALERMRKNADEELAKLRVHSIADLGTWKFAQWAEWIADLADFEEDGE